MSAEPQQRVEPASDGESEFALISTVFGLLGRAEVGLFVLVVLLSLLTAAVELLGLSVLAQILSMLSDGLGIAEIPVLGAVGKVLADYTLKQQIVAIAMLLGFAMLLRAAVEFCARLVATILPLRIGKRLNLEGFGRMLNSELSFVQGIRWGQLQNSVQAFPDQIGTAVGRLADVAFNGILLVGYLLVAFLVSPWLVAGIAVFFVCTYQLRRVTLDRAVERVAAAQQLAASRRHGAFQEAVWGATLVRLLAAENRIAARYGELVDEFRRTQLKRQVLQSLPSAFLMVMVGLAATGVLLYLSTFPDEQISAWLARFVILLALLTRVMRPVTAVHAGVSQFTGYVPALKGYRAFVQQAARREQPSGNIEAPSIREGLSLRSLTFRYEGEDEPALDDVAFDIPRGAMVGIVGSSGAGKSTLVAILSRLLEPPRGSVFVDGTDFLDLEVRSWRRRLSVVSQDTFLINSTIRENIRFGTEASDEEVAEAARTASADEFIDRLPLGFDTLIGDRGYKLSGGQKQRLAIARALLYKPEFLILDEATSQLDAYTERAVQASLETLARGATLLVIAHRLVTVQRCDSLVVLERGRVVETGTHDELIVGDGVYAGMFQLQSMSQG